MSDFTKPSTENILILPLMMFGRNGNHWHTEGEPVKIRYISEYTTFKTGKRKDEPKPIYAWKIKTERRKTLVGFHGHFKSGKNKGKPKPVYETLDTPVMSSGFFPTVNHIYMNTRGGRKLKPIAEDHLAKWRTLAQNWKQKNNWQTLQPPTKVVLEIMYYLPSGHNDTHNTKKLLLDALESVIHTDDYYMLDRTIDFTIDNENPRIEIHVSVPDNLLPLQF